MDYRSSHRNLFDDIFTYSMNYNEDSDGGLTDPDVATSFTCVSDPGEHGSVHGVQASGFDVACGSPPPGPSTVQGHKRKLQYNRQTIRIEDFIGKALENITAKQYRVLIPLMFQTLIFPNKEIAKTKVKGLWEQGNCPNSWPGDVRFRDPNNNPKFQIWESKLVFQFLREQLSQYPKYRVCLRQPVKPKTEPRKPPSPRATETSHHQVIPNLPTLNPGHLRPSFEVHRESIGIQEEGSDIKPVLPQIPPLTMALQYTSAGSPIPTLVEQMDEGLIAKTQGVTLKEEPLQSPPQTSSQYCFDEGVLSSMQPQVVEVLSSDRAENEGQTLTSLTLLQTAAVPCEAQMPSFPTEAQQQSNVMYVYRDEHSTQPVNPQSCEIQPIPGTAQPECVEFASTVQTSLVPIVTEFSKMFQTEPSVMDKVEEVIGDTFVPMFNAAKCSKLTCAELSKLGGRLQEMLKRFTFMKDSYSVDNIVIELDSLQADFKVQELVIDTNVPEATYEVQVMTALNNTFPTLVNETNPFIPTIAGLEERAQQKLLQLEKNIEAIDYVDSEKQMSVDKSKSLMSPLCNGVQGMDLDETDTEQSLVDPEQDYGIKLRDGECEEKNEEYPVSVQDMERYLSEGHIWGIDVRPASSEEADEIVNILLDNQPVQRPSTATTAQQEATVTVNEGFNQMPVDCNMMENQAVDSTMAAMYSRFGGSMTSETPLTTGAAFDDMYITEEVLSLMDDYISQGYSLEGTVPECVAVDVLSPKDEPPPKMEPATSPDTSRRQAVFAELSKTQSAVIPTTVLEAAAAQDQVQGRRGCRSGKRQSRRH